MAHSGSPTATTIKGANKRVRINNSNELQAPQKKRARTDSKKLDVRAVSKKPEVPFRFLDLPGELRNRVYELACADTHRYFPTLTFKSEHKRRRRSFARGTTTDIPFMALTHANVQLRTEFRSQWLNGVRIPLCAVQSFLATFLTKKKLEGVPRPIFDPSGSLRIWLRKMEMERRDITRLVKHKAMYPEFDISFNHLPEFQPWEVQDLESLLNNSHPLWIRWVKSSVISLVNLDVRLSCIVIVLKEKHAPQWARKTAGQIVPDGYLATLGLNPIRFWRFDFGVDYN
ncbi:hypothetical protein P280DRAFT_458071 [Massarina eburnea CBS 473.64]|uniref:F-box domain-containing protein n=1 Tax=Massarina eburnea CBS 473.64 TaxID=1395130 RepID=A0A6A6RT40_9PLEO|nr:hypothetical protein P280DRAFT_458071 [Massarina eburnea CBS 473.64]